LCGQCIYGRTFELDKGDKMQSSEALHWIFARRSIRKFTGQPVEEEKIQAILEAAMAAPSAHNAKPWHFIVVRDREKLKTLAEKHPYAKMCHKAGAAIVVCADSKTAPGYWVLDCAAATQNMLLAGTALGLGTVWIGMHPREERKRMFRPLFGIPEDMEICSIVALGYPAERKEPRTQYDPSRVHREQW